MKYLPMILTGLGLIFIIVGSHELGSTDNMAWIILVATGGGLVTYNMAPLILK